MRKDRRAFLAGAGRAGLAAGLWAIPGAARAQVASGDLVARAFEMVDGDGPTRRAAIEFFRRRGARDAVPALVQVLRFMRVDRETMFDALTSIAGENPGDEWFFWQRWIEANPDIVGFDGFAGFKAEMYGRIDPAFRRFLRDGVAADIRIEEIVWGNTTVDGIPALDDPALTAAGAATDLDDDDLVFGVEIGGAARAYPQRILDWHEMANDVVGGVAVALAYCTLCGAGVLYRTGTADDRRVFGSSGLLHRSNKLMFDRATDTLWSQLSGRPVVGPLVGRAAALETLPIAVTSWGAWRAAHPQTTVLSIETGYDRDYATSPYARYFARDSLLFPALVGDDALAAKDFVFALRDGGPAVAWPLERFAGGAVLNEQAGVAPVTLIGDAATRTVRAYRTDGRALSRSASGALTDAAGAEWSETEAALVGPGGETFQRLPGHVVYWFAWSGAFGDGGRLATGD